MKSALTHYVFSHVHTIQYRLCKIMIHVITNQITLNSILASVGLRSIGFPIHTDYILTAPSCPSSPMPATMAGSEEQRDADMLWRNKPCNLVKMSKEDTVPAQPASGGADSGAESGAVPLLLSVLIISAVSMLQNV